MRRTIIGSGSHAPSIVGRGGGGGGGGGGGMHWGGGMHGGGGFAPMHGGGGFAPMHGHGGHWPHGGHGWGPGWGWGGWGPGWGGGYGYNVIDVAPAGVQLWVDNGTGWIRSWVVADMASAQATATNLGRPVGVSNLGANGPDYILQPRAF